ncbi:MAG: hypothetical protein R2792_07585 [Saprospiraceae bacterium]
MNHSRFFFILLFYLLLYPEYGAALNCNEKQNLPPEIGKPALPNKSGQRINEWGGEVKLLLPFSRKRTIKKKRKRVAQTADQILHPHAISGAVLSLTGLLLVLAVALLNLTIPAFFLFLALMMGAAGFNISSKALKTIRNEPKKYKGQGLALWGKAIGGALVFFLLGFALILLINFRKPDWWFI